MTKSTLEIADQYHELGWVILPLGRNQKIPMLKQWNQKTLADHAQLREEIKPYSNLGVRMGKCSNLICIDVDVKNPNKNGMTTLRRLESLLGKLPHTVQSQTPSGGVHYFFKYPTDVDIINKRPVGDGIDIQSDSSQTVIYPSLYEGNPYVWVNDPFTTELAELPTLWKYVLSDAYVPLDGVTKDDIMLRYTEQSSGTKIRLMKTEPFELPEIVEVGCQDNTMMKFSRSLLGQGKTEEEVREICYRENQKRFVPPIANKDMERILNSSFRTHQRNLKAQIREAREKAMQEEDFVVDDDWVIISPRGKKSVDDNKFIKWFVDEYDIINVGGEYGSRDGKMTEFDIKRKIIDLVAPYHNSGSLYKNAESYLKTLKARVRPIAMDLNPHAITLGDGLTYEVRDGKLVEIDVEFIPNRFKYVYNPNAQCPNWEKHMSNLFAPDDLKVVKQYLGYCLIPSTKLQKALFICGHGGEGKSRITYVLSHIFESPIAHKQNIVSGDITRLEKDRFMLSSLVQALVFIDDDINMSYLQGTDTFKKLVTADAPLQIERKYAPMVMHQLYTKIIGMGNGFPKTMFDKSDGWNRRILPVRTQPTPADRPYDAFINEKLISEAEGIFRWLVDGLLELSRNHFKLDLSENILATSKELERDNNNVIAFCESDRIEFTGHPKDKVSNEDLEQVYREWCRSFDTKPLESFKKYIKEYIEKQKIEGVNFQVIRDRTGKSRQGVKGLKIRESFHISVDD